MFHCAWKRRDPQEKSRTKISQTPRGTPNVKESSGDQERDRAWRGTCGSRDSA
jgi:hypothetical protein